MAVVQQIAADAEANEIGSGLGDEEVGALGHSFLAQSETMSFARAVVASPRTP